jgi:hypothetical protein
VKHERAPCRCGHQHTGAGDHPLQADPAPGSSGGGHLQFRRYAGCPFCNLHLRSIVQRHQELVAAGIREVVVFQSSSAELLAQQGDAPFAVIADPTRRLYAQFGVVSSPRAVLDPRAWLAGSVPPPASVPRFRLIYRGS